MNINFKINNEQAHLSGIYLIRNNTNQKFYIGSAADFYNRWSCHISDLRLNRHTNKHLQASFNKNSENDFTFHIIEIIENKEDLFHREQYFIDTLQPHYNICKQVGRPPIREWTDETREKHREVMRNREISDEAKQRMLEALEKGRNNYHERSEEVKAEHRKKISKALTGRKLSEEHRKKCAEARLGTTLTDEHKQAIRQANSNDYTIIDPEQNEYTVTNGLLSFAKQHNLDESMLAKCARGEYKHHKGWQCFLTSEFSPDKIQDPKSFKVKGETVYHITTPEGNTEITNNLYEYAREHNLDGSSLCKVAKGKLKHHKQYKVS